MILSVLMSRIAPAAAMAVVCLFAAAPVIAQSPAYKPESGGTWETLKGDIVGDRPVIEDTSVIELQAPVRAEDAAITPVAIVAKIPQTPERFIRQITLVIDENPAPVAGTFTFGPAAAEASLSTRVRVDSYSYIRAIAELNDGSLYMVKKFVKASGGCSAPAGKDQDQAMAQLGKMKLRQFPLKETAKREAQIMLPHLRHSGLQRDQITLLYIPAFYIRELEVKRGGDLIFKMEGGISISEDPNIRFFFRGAEGEIEVMAKDTKDNEFQSRWPVGAEAS